MEQEDVKPGVRVALINEHEDVGVILDKKTKAGYVWVDWIFGDITQIHIDYIVLEENVAAIEAEFNRVSEQIKEKMQQAAELMKQSRELANSIDSSLGEMYDAVQPIFDEMEENGWQTSSLQC